MSRRTNTGSIWVYPRARVGADTSKIIWGEYLIFRTLALSIFINNLVSVLTNTLSLLFIDNFPFATFTSSLIITTRTNDQSATLLALLFIVLTIAISTHTTISTIWDWIWIQSLAIDTSSKVLAVDIVLDTDASSVPVRSRVLINLIAWYTLT